MKRSNIVATVGGWLAGAGLALAQSDISLELEPIRVKYHLPARSVIAVKEGRILAQGAAGVRRIGQTNRLTVADQVNIGSCTKWMTATVAGRLVDRPLSLGLSYGAALPPNAAVWHDLARGQAQAVPRAPIDAGILLRYQAAYGPGGFVVCTLQDWTKFLHAQVTSDISNDTEAHKYRYISSLKKWL